MINNHRIKNKIGLIVGKVQVFSRGPDVFQGKCESAMSSWWCKCLTCGSGLLLSSRNLVKNRKKRRLDHGCLKCSYRERQLKNRKPQGHSGLILLYGQYRNNANKANRDFTFSIEEFKEITSKNCNYCGALPLQIAIPPHNKGRTEDGCNWAAYIHNGIDRIDNDKGYTKDNSVPCCGVCNLMKRRWSQEFFLEHINKINNFNK